LELAPPTGVVELKRGLSIVLLPEGDSAKPIPVPPIHSSISIAMTIIGMQTYTLSIILRYRYDHK